MNDPVWTPVALVRSAQDYLERHQIENARLNAERLLAHTLGVPRIELYLQHDRPVADGERNRFREMLRRRARHEPLQYILGQVEFAGVQIAVGPGVLVPRPETECLVEAAIATLRGRHGGKPLRILDVGCGSGCIAVALAAALPDADVDAVDIDSTALEFTRRNAARNRVGDRVQVIQADACAADFLAAVNPPYDAMISNPPYVAETDLDALAPEVRDWEPHQALIAGGDGLDFFRQLVRSLPRLLGADGFAALETGANQAAAVAAMFNSVFTTVTIARDLAQVPRIVTASNLREQSSIPSGS